MEAGIDQRRVAPGSERGTILRLEPTAPVAGSARGDSAAAVEIVWTAVLDTTWTVPITGSGETDLIGLRDVAARVLGSRDLIAEAAKRLDAWVADSGVVDILTVDGTSFWYRWRVRHWMWLLQRVLYSAIVDELIAEVRPASIVCASGTPPDLVEAARSAARRDGLGFSAEDADEAAAIEPLPPGGPDPLELVPDGTASERPASERPAGGDAPPKPSRRSSPPSIPARLVHRIGRAFGRKPPVDERTRRRRLIRARLERFRAERGRLLVVLAHARQLVDTPTGLLWMNPYLGPVRERLRGTRLEPIEVDLRLRTEDEGWDRAEEPRGDRLLTAEVFAMAAPEEGPASGREEATAIADRLHEIATPLLVDGIDLGPQLATNVEEVARRTLGPQIRQYRRIRELLRQLRPAAILLADEYHRQDWLGAAHAEGIASVAVQHGLIYRWHNGYVHPVRPDALRLPNRTYVFGEWERRLLLEQSVYRDDEVRVGGSPRLDYAKVREVDRDAVRRELRIAEGDRLVVLSATWAAMYRSFFYPIALARLFDRPLPRVHLVVKLHPSEPDEGPYRAIIEGIAAAGGFAPPTISVVQHVDLYRLLAAADAHLGIHSTVLTEAVVTGTPNLLADVFIGSDLLGYVEAGVARPVRSGADVLAALDDPPDPAADAARRRAFLEAHFEPGSASERIAADLQEWLT
jgi:hypothetical protein